MNINTGINKALNYLNKNQQTSGEFSTYTSPNLDMKEAQTYSKSVYLTTFIIHALTLPYFTDNHIAKNIVQKAADFLESEREENGDWNYEGFGEHRVPNDLDDTSTATAALKQAGRDPGFHFYAHLWQNEQVPGGPYYTWLGINKLENDSQMVRQVDALVNANVLFCSGLLQGPLPGCVNYLIDVIKHKNWQAHSLYCISPHFLIYTITRAYADANITDLAVAMPDLQDYILNELPPPPSEASALNITCLATSLLNCQTPPTLIEPYVQALLTHQRPDGSWPAWATWAGYAPNYDGGPALTTALAIEALVKYNSVIG